MNDFVISFIISQNWAYITVTTLVYTSRKLSLQCTIQVWISLSFIILTELWTEMCIFQVRPLIGLFRPEHSFWVSRSAHMTNRWQAGRLKAEITLTFLHHAFWLWLNVLALKRTLLFLSHCRCLYEFMFPFYVSLFVLATRTVHTTSLWLQHARFLLQQQRVYLTPIESVCVQKWMGEKGLRCQCRGGSCFVWMCVCTLLLIFAGSGWV